MHCNKRFLPIICFVFFFHKIIVLAFSSSARGVKTVYTPRSLCTDDRVEEDIESSSSRRAFFASVSAAAILGLSAAKVVAEPPPIPEQRYIPFFERKPVELVDVQKVLKENKIQIYVYENNTKTTLNSTSFEKIQEIILPDWLPSFLRRKMNPIITSKISDRELLSASIIAGCSTEVLRTGILYPITTIKTRIQVSPNMRRTGSFRTMLRELAVSLIIQSKAGDLYSGIIPSILISAPASGLYYGVKEVMRRQLMTFTTFDDLSNVLISVVVADVASLAFRTPAVIYSVRKQAEKAIDIATVDEFDKEGNLINILDVDGDLEFPEKQENNTGMNFWADCVEQLPVIIITDLPYLVLKTVILRSIVSGGESVFQYDVLNTLAALVASFITTPFDVVRTRILVDSDLDPQNGLDGGSKEGILEAMKTILYENGSPRVENLYRGWLERIFYYSIGIAWLEPVRLLCYYGIRDVLLLEVFS